VSPTTFAVDASHSAYIENPMPTSLQAKTLAYARVRIIEDRVDDANLDPNASNALQTLDGAQRVTIHLGTISIERVRPPAPEQASILAARKVEGPSRPRGNTQNEMLHRHDSATIRFNVDLTPTP